MVSTLKWYMKHLQYMKDTPLAEISQHGDIEPRVFSSALRAKRKGLIGRDCGKSSGVRTLGLVVSHPRYLIYAQLLDAIRRELLQVCSGEHFSWMAKVDPQLG